MQEFDENGSLLMVGVLSASLGRIEMGTYLLVRIRCGTTVEERIKEERRDGCEVGCMLH